MKRQQDSKKREAESELLPESGTAIAKLSSTSQGQDLGVDYIPVHPIDTLLVQQLENILDGEKALRAKYSAIDSTMDTPETRRAFSRELSSLQVRADRLYRLMDAMEFYGPYEANGAPSFSPSAA